MGVSSLLFIDKKASRLSIIDEKASRLSIIDEKASRLSIIDEKAILSETISVILSENLIKPKPFLKPLSEWRKCSL